MALQTNSIRRWKKHHAQKEEVLRAKPHTIAIERLPQYFQMHTWTTNEAGPTGCNKMIHAQFKTIQIENKACERTKERSMHHSHRHERDCKQNVTNNRESQCWCQNQQAHCVCQVASQCQTSTLHKKDGNGKQQGVPKHVGACLNEILHRKLVQELTQCERTRTKEHECAKQLLHAVADVSDPTISGRQVPHMFRNGPLTAPPSGQPLDSASTR